MTSSTTNYSNPNNNNINLKEKLPIINLSIKNQDQLIKQVRNACKFGFFYIVGHNIEQSLIDKVYEYSRILLSLPNDEKMKFKIKLGCGDSNLGYFGIGASYGTQIDHKEGVYLDLESNGCDCYSIIEGIGNSGLVGFKDTIEMYISKLKYQSIKIIELIALGLNLSSNYFYQHQYTSDPHFNLGLLKYPSFHQTKATNSQIEYGIGPHCDWSLITLLYQDSVGGLQVNSDDDGWIEASPIEGSFICNLGDMMQILTNGYFKSRYHQVEINKSGRDRYSIPFFFNPNRYTPIVQISGIPENLNSNNDDRENELLQFNGSYNDYHLYKMNKLFNKFK